MDVSKALYRDPVVRIHKKTKTIDMCGVEKLPFTHTDKNQLFTVR